MSDPIPIEMDKQKMILFFDLCRLCLEKPGVKDIFEATNLIEDIFQCTGVKVAANDNLPKKICMTCLDIIVKAKHLKELSVANEAYLKILFGDNNDEKEKDSQEMETSENNHININTTDTEVQQGTTDNRTTNKKYEYKEHKSQRKKESKEKHDSNKRRISDTSEHIQQPTKKLSVRKDLFDTSAVTSSTNESEHSEPTESKNVKAKFNQSIEYICEICNKSFSVWKKLYLHQRSHVKNIMCPLDACGKKFTTKGDLEKHIRTHTGERPYGCDLCDKRFTQRGTLRVHRETVHSGRQYIT